MAEPTGRIIELDGLRGLAVLGVLFAHYVGEAAHGYRIFALGWAGVDFFFVLSGFLIGGILFDNVSSAGYFSTFYIRRAFRIFPIYYLSITLVLLFTAAAGPPHPAWIDPPLPAISYYAYIQNFWMTFAGQPEHRWLLPTWTLAVEEQFYLLLPLVIFVVPARHRLAAIVAFIASAPVLRALFLFGIPAHQIGAYVLLPCRWDLLFLGVLVAHVRRDGKLWARATAGAMIEVKATVLAGALAVVLAALIDQVLHLKLFDLCAPTFLGFCFAAFLLLVVSGAPEGERFRSRLLCFFGAISYGLYLIHQPVAGIMHGLILGARPDIETWPQLLVTIAALAISAALAWLSFRYFESPLLRIGHGWTYGARRRTDADRADPVTTGRLS